MTAAVKIRFIIVTRRSSTKQLSDNHASFFSMATLSSGSRACKASNGTSTSPEKSSFRNTDSFHIKKPDRGIHSFPLPGRSSHLLQCHPCFYYFLFFIFVKNYILAKYINFTNFIIEWYQNHLRNLQNWKFIFQDKIISQLYLPNEFSEKNPRRQQRLNRMQNYQNREKNGYSNCRNSQRHWQEL